jgi:hypothetical protein
LGAEHVQVMMPDLPWLRDAFQAAGYGYGDWEGELWVFEIHLPEAPRGTDDDMTTGAPHNTQGVRMGAP